MKRELAQKGLRPSGIDDRAFHQVKWLVNFTPKETRYRPQRYIADWFHRNFWMHRNSSESIARRGLNILNYN